MPDGIDAAKPFWQLGLDFLHEQIGGSAHPLDRKRARLLARGMRMVGEAPRYPEVSAYVAKLWSATPWTADMVRNTWRSVYRASTSLGRDGRVGDTPLYVPDLLIERHSLRPATEERLAVIARAALDAVLHSAEEDDVATFQQRKRDLDAALVAVEQLRFLRHGSVVLDYPDANPVSAQRPRWW